MRWCPTACATWTCRPPPSGSGGPSRARAEDPPGSDAPEDGARAVAAAVGREHDIGELDVGGYLVGDPPRGAVAGEEGAGIRERRERGGLRRVPGAPELVL